MKTITTTISTRNAGGEVEITVVGTHHVGENGAPAHIDFEGAGIEGCTVDLSKPEKDLAIQALWEKYREDCEREQARAEDARQLARVHRFERTKSR